MLNILHKNEVGNSVEFTAGNKFEVKPDNSGNVQFEITTQGLKGNVELPAEFDASEIQRKLQEAETTVQELQQALNAEKAKVTALETKVQSLESREDIHVTNAEIVEDTKLKISIEGAEAVTVDLAKFLNVIDSSAIYRDIKDTILADVKEAIKGEEVQDFSGNTKGYLITKE